MIRRPTRTMRSMPNGTRKINPGPRIGLALPRRNTTARSYSRRILRLVASAPAPPIAMRARMTSMIPSRTIRVKMGCGRQIYGTIPFRTALRVGIPERAETPYGPSWSAVHPNHDRDPLPPTDAGRAETVSTTATTEFVEQRSRDPRTRSTQRMRQRDRPSVHVHPVPIET